MSILKRGHLTIALKRGAHHAGEFAIQDSDIVQSPIRLVLLIGLCVFLGETFVMIVLSYLQPTPLWFEAIFDSSLLIILLSPVLYLFVYGPFVHHITVLKRAEAELFAANAELENRVTERTAELQANEEQLSAKAAELEKANYELSQYAYVVAHDLQAPLRAINNYVNFLQEDMDSRLEGEQKEYLDALGRAVYEANELVQGLLELSRIGRGGTSFESIDSGTFLKEIINSISLPANAKITMADDWPTIEADSRMLRQIFQNLIENAVKFNNSPTILVELGWRRQTDGSYEFRVSDNGIGIDTRYHEQIFRVFERLHTRKDYKGCGIGLAIVKKATDTLGGSIRMESKYGQGSTFFVALPETQRV
jgi:light-regulated signal transduction histidine kinase (bacteriophytochrome)